jgi:hypothetical protein
MEDSIFRQLHLVFQFKRHTYVSRLNQLHAAQYPTGVAEYFLEQLKIEADKQRDRIEQIERFSLRS